MVLLVRHPPTREPERRYALDVVLREFLGLEYRAIAENRTDTCITNGEEQHGGQIIVPESLFGVADDEWLTGRSLPHEKLRHWTVSRELLDDSEQLGADLPVLYGGEQSSWSFETGAAEFVLPVDVFAGAFLLLTRYEELVTSDRDEWDRFHSSQSVLSREGLLERPLVNEYVELLWRVITRLWPRLTRRRRSYRPLLTHDVDAFSVTELASLEMVRSLGADILRRRDPALFARRTVAFIVGRARKRPRPYDPYNTSGFIMDVSEQAGLRSAFNFAAGASEPTFDPRYDVASPSVRDMLRSVAARGHEIGFHPSYRTYLDSDRTSWEFARLQQVCGEEGIQQSQWGGRQHYLRWRNPTTWRNWERCGLAYDSTLGFADRVGFRTGTCWEYPVFDLLERRTLSLRERPLVAMESSLLSYMRVPLDEAADRLKGLSRICRVHKGDFTLLWHGHMLVSREVKRVYADVVREIA